MGVPKKEKIISEIMDNSQKFRQQREVVTIDYKPTFDKKEDEEENKKIVAKPDNKQKVYSNSRFNLC